MPRENACASLFLSTFPQGFFFFSIGEAFAKGRGAKGSIPPPGGGGAISNQVPPSPKGKWGLREKRRERKRALEKRLRTETPENRCGILTQHWLLLFLLLSIYTFHFRVSALHKLLSKVVVMQLLANITLFKHQTILSNRFFPHPLFVGGDGGRSSSGQK